MLNKKDAVIILLKLHNLLESENNKEIIFKKMQLFIAEQLKYSESIEKLSRHTLNKPEELVGLYGALTGTMSYEQGVSVGNQMKSIIENTTPVVSGFINNLIDQNKNK